MIKILENNAFKLIEVENNIFHWHFYSGELSLEDYMFGYNLAKEYFIKNGKISVITSHDSNFHFSTKTWAFLTNKKTDYAFIQCQAIIIKQLHLRILISFFSKIHKKSFKLKYFSSYEKGLDWLKKEIVLTKVCELKTH